MGIGRIGIKCQSLLTFLFRLREVPEITEVEIG